MKKNASVFISIASYRDPELIPTIHNCIQAAQYPENVNIAVCWQHDEDETIFTDAGMTLHEKTSHAGFARFTFLYNGATLNVLSVPFARSQGACWARNLAETLYNRETYFLQIDSHCRFVEHWDSQMIALLSDLRNTSIKPVLSTYPPAYFPTEKGKWQQFINRLIFREFTSEGIIMLSSTTFEAQVPVRGSYLAGGFIFADGSFVEDVPNDPEIFFAGEEIAMALRAFTHGYDVYTPHKILLWHYYDRKEHHKIWSDHTNEAKQAGKVDLAWWERDKLSKTRVRTVLGVESAPCELGRFGPGTVRSRAEFERAIGASFQHRTVHPKVVGKNRVSYFPPTDIDDDTWLSAMVSPNRKEITFKISELNLEQKDILWWYVGVYTRDNVLLEQKKLKREEIESRRNLKESDALPLFFEFPTTPSVKPETVRLCPFISPHGWGKVVEKSW
ncbi:GlcNAc-transferase family protein [Scandinavium goeteborgense]|uniref:GlcNAc-transferase family protein n=1 Tax=Scandinavium goeteborgense TaxID=1851514 RepID=UPI0038269840